MYTYLVGASSFAVLTSSGPMRDRNSGTKSSPISSPGLIMAKVIQGPLK